MDFDTIRPIISGLVGATVATFLGLKWSKRLPLAGNQSEQKELLRIQKNTIRIANVGAGIGMITGLILYLGGFSSDTDWRGLGLCLGLMSFLPSVVIVIANISKGIEGIKDGFNAYAISQKAPVVFLYPVMLLMIFAGLWAIVAFTM